MITHEKFTTRHYQPDDYPALAELINASNRAMGTDSRISAEELTAIIQVPDFNPRTDSLILEDGGRLVAMSNHGYSAASGQCWDDSVVHPDYWGQGIGAELIRLTEARCLEWAKTALTAEQPVLLQLAVSEKNARGLRLFEAQGYRHVRSFYEMQIEFDQSGEAGQPVEAQPLPSGLTLRSFDEARDAHAVHEAAQEAFIDHWGYERMSFDSWAHHLLHHPNGDLSLWLIAYDGDEIAGVCLNRSGTDEDPLMAWVNVLGVPRPWRRRGLGLALLKNSFALFRQRGYTGAGLMVDASNATNAVGLYERAGMHVQRCKRVYHKMLRAGAPEETP
jgi:mycothiol synthase